MAPVLSLLFVASFWGMVWYPLRLLEQGGLSGPWQLLVIYLSALAVMLVFLRPHLGRGPGAWWQLLLLALAGGWTNVGFVAAVLDGTVARALLLFYLSPLWATLLGRLFLGEHISRVMRLALPLGLLGAGMMLWRPTVGLPWPLHATDLLALSAGFAFAVANLMTRALRGLSTEQKTAWTWVGAILLAGGMILLWQEPWPTAAPPIWGGSVLLGIGGFFFATLAAVYGVSRLPLQRSSVILLVEILIGSLTAWWLVGEALSPREWLGGGLILAAGILAIHG
jgi:drug/metabolite transporter (DMT)-like permease